MIFHDFRGFCRYSGFCDSRDQRGRPAGPPRALRVRFLLEWKSKIDIFGEILWKSEVYHQGQGRGNTIQISLRKFRNLKFSIPPNLLLSGRGATRAWLDVQKRVLNARPRGSEPRTLYLNCMVLSRQSTGTQRNLEPTKSRFPQQICKISNSVGRGEVNIFVLS